MRLNPELFSSTWIFRIHKHPDLHHLKPSSSSSSRRRLTAELLHQWRYNNIATIAMILIHSYSCFLLSYGTPVLKLFPIVFPYKYSHLFKENNWDREDKKGRIRVNEWISWFYGKVLCFIKWIIQTNLVIFLLE
jgi:hypothetical protein